MRIHWTGDQSPCAHTGREVRVRAHILDGRSGCVRTYWTGGQGACAHTGREVKVRAHTLDEEQC